MKTILSFLILNLIFSQITLADIRFPQDKESWIQITNENEAVTFFLCDEDFGCNLIGDGPYPIAKLINLKSSKYDVGFVKIGKSLVLIGGGVVLGVLAGATVGAVLTTKAATLSSGGLMGISNAINGAAYGAGGGLLVGGAKAHNMDSPTLSSSFSDGRLLRNRVIHDKNVSIKNTSALDHAIRLESFLQNIFISDPLD